MKKSKELLTLIVIFSIFLLVVDINCQAETIRKEQQDGEIRKPRESSEQDNQYTQTFKLIIIVGGYIAVIIGAVIFRLQARQSKVIQFQQVLGKGSVSSTEHKFEELHEQNDFSSTKKSPVQYEPAGGDSTKRKRRKRKADRLSDRRKNNENNESIENNEEGED